MKQEMTDREYTTIALIILIVIFLIAARIEAVYPNY